MDKEDADCHSLHGMDKLPDTDELRLRITARRPSNTNTSDGAGAGNIEMDSMPEGAPRMVTVDASKMEILSSQIDTNENMPSPPGDDATPTASISPTKKLLPGAENLWKRIKEGFKSLRLPSSPSKHKYEGSWPNMQHYLTEYEKDRDIEKLYSTLKLLHPPLSELEDYNALMDLVDKIRKQIYVKQMLKKTYTSSISSVTYLSTGSLIETERSLLLALLRETAARDVLEKAIRKNIIERPIRTLSFLTLSDFQFKVGEKRDRNTHDYIYVVVCSYKHQVYMTQIGQQHNNEVRIKGPITFHDIDEHYKIKVEIYGHKMTVFDINCLQNGTRSLCYMIRVLPNNEGEQPTIDFCSFYVFKLHGAAYFTPPSSHTDAIYSTYSPSRERNQESMQSRQTVDLVEQPISLLLMLKKQNAYIASIDMRMKTEILPPMTPEPE